MYSWNCCRTCLNTRSLHPIFVNTTQSDKYTKTILTITGIKVEMNDSMPQVICLECINFINESIKFRRKCEEVQNMLTENRTKCNGIKFENLKAEKDDCHPSIDISDTYDDDFRDFDDNITLDALQYHNIAKNDINKDKIDVKSIRNNLPDDNNDKLIKTVDYSGDCNDKSDNYEMLLFHKTETDKSNDDTVNSIIENISGDSDDKIEINSIQNHDRKNKINKNNVKIKLDDKPIHLIEKQNLFIKKRKTRVKTVRKKEKNDEDGKTKEEIECEFCHKILTSKLSLRNHYKIHTGFDIVCEHCGKKFITRRLLLMHCRAKHGYEKTDKCSYCDYRASNAEQVKIHERLHTGEKPFVCKTCGAGFHRKSSYLQHVAIHLPEKTVQCDQCPARFKSVTLMRIHKNRHRPSQYTFKCGVCNNSFARRRNVARHLQRVHGLTPDHHIHRIKIH